MAPIEGVGPSEGAFGKSLKAYALAQLARREYSRSELQRKLLLRAQTVVARAPPFDARVQPSAPDAVPVARGDTDAVPCVDAVLDWLEAHRYLSEQRFVESRVRVRSERFGTMRIRHELAQHGLQFPARAEAALLESELDRALAICVRKFGAAPTTLADEAKRARFLAGRGFSGEVIRQVLRRVRSGESIHTASQTPPDSEITPGTRATLPR